MLPMPCEWTTCILCACVKEKRKCNSCYPLCLGQCKTVHASLELESNDVDQRVKTSRPISRDSEKSLPSLDNPQVKFKTMTDSGLPNTSSVSEPNMDFVDKKMYEAFGVTLIRTTEFQASYWNNLCLLATKLCGKLYDLPGGAVGRHFVNYTATELNK